MNPYDDDPFKNDPDFQMFYKPFEEWAFGENDPSGKTSTERLLEYKKERKQKQVLEEFKQVHDLFGLNPYLDPTALVVDGLGGTAYVNLQILASSGALKVRGIPLKGVLDGGYQILYDGTHYNLAFKAGNTSLRISLF